MHLFRQGYRRRDARATKPAITADQRRLYRKSPTAGSADLIVFGLHWKVEPPIPFHGNEIADSGARRQIKEFQRCVLKTAANRAAPVREAVISVPTRSRSRTR